ncbi:peptide ABC transporter substrate-binding protein [Streptococcus iniae]|uniref:peptide ABC transporter substrate-binding protein n=1 Tax=Streptococcus iniae TaxID=1346 RepID=UPI000EF79897|nr:peptide ABC transporter substrate-binding protein [Streptococcus iniae]RLU44805.1 peptide ABC transporter substrate-binding protein [Streptococcus iniae]
MKTWKTFAIAGLTLATVTTLVACGGKSDSANSASKDQINWYTPTEIITLDVSKNTDRYSAMAIGNSGSNLLRVDKTGALKPDLAKKLEISKDGKTYTATLRDNLKWSDGSKLTAEDFVYTWQRMVDPKTASEYSYLTTDAHLHNADKLISGELTDLSELGVKADGNKVIFTLDNPAPQFESLLSFSNFVPQKKAFVEKAGGDYGTSSEKVLYSGPYVVKGWNGTSGSFKLVKNKNYWNAKNVKTKTVAVQAVKKPDTAVQMYKQGQLDFANISGTSAIYNANKKNKDKVEIAEARADYLAYNETGTVKALSNQKIRQALNLATDRQGLVKAAVDTGSKPAKALAPAGLATLTDGTDLGKHVAQPYQFDKEAAAKLFKEGLQELGIDSLTLTMTADSDNPAKKAAVDYLKESWEKNLPGFTLEEKFVTFKQRLADTKKQNFEIAFVSWGGDYPEGSTFYGLFTTVSDYNYGKVASPEYDAAYKNALTTNALDKDAAADDYKAAEKVLFEGAHYNPLYALSNEGLQNPNLKGLVRNSTGLDVDFTTAYKTK